MSVGKNKKWGVAIWGAAESKEKGKKKVKKWNEKATSHTKGTKKQTLYGGYERCAYLSLTL